MRLQAICPVSEDALKPEPLPVEPPGVPGQRTTKSRNPPGQYWFKTYFIAKFLYSNGVGSQAHNLSNDPSPKDSTGTAKEHGHKQ